MRYIFSDVIVVVLVILILAFFLLGQVEKNSRIELAQKIYSDPTCVLTENTYSSVSSKTVVKQVYKCSNSTYEFDYDLSIYEK